MRSYTLLIKQSIIIFILFIIPVILTAQPPSTPVSPMATTDGTVLCIVKSGDTLFLGGSFMMLKNPDNSIALRNRIAAIDLKTGFALPWNPNSDGPVLGMALDGNTLYVGGGFTNIGGQNRNNIAALKTNTDNFIAKSWNPNANDVVTRLVMSGANIYCAGSFSMIGGANRSGLACVTTMLDANNATTWNPAPNGAINDILLVGNTLYVAGTFITIGGQSRNNLAAVNTANNNATDWNPNANNTVLSISYLGNTLYASGSFTAIGGQSRARIAAINMLTMTNNATDWNPNVNGNINSMKAFDGRVYIGGSFPLVNGISRNFIASLNASQNTNNTTSWYPILDSYVEKIMIQDSIVFISGNFSKVNDANRPRFAIFKPVLPTLTTKFVTNITTNSAVSGGNITTDGGPSIIARGVCWSINPNPTINDFKTIDSSGIGSYTSNMTGLNIYTNYRVRAYATSSLGTAYGNEITFNTNPAIYTGNLTTQQFCSGDSVVIPFTVSPGFEDANYFIAQMSDQHGSFAEPVILDSIHSKEPGEIRTRIPSTTTYGIGYRFRIVATQPSSTLRDNNTDIQVNELPNVTLGTLPDVCVNITPIDLTGGMPVGGEYSGKGISNNQFNPSVAGAGTHTITYTYSNAFGCANKAVATIKVNPLPVVTMQIQPDICIDAESIPVTGGTPQGGTYSGDGISGTTFNPKTAGLGKHTITYSFTDSNGCSNSSSADINVNPLPQVSIASFADVCLNTQPFQLTGGTPTGGEYTGTGINNNTFNPSVAGIGTHDILYKYTDNKGCSESALTTIIVKSIPPKPVVTQLDYRTLSSSADVGNQWFMNQVIMPNETSKEIRPKLSGNYSVQVFGDNTCFSDMSDEYAFNNLAVDDIMSSKLITVYPVPADYEIMIQINSDSFLQFNISISNLLGEKLVSKEFLNNSELSVIKLNIADLSEGIYYLNVSFGNEIINKKIIVQR